MGDGEGGGGDVSTNMHIGIGLMRVFGAQAIDTLHKMVKENSVNDQLCAALCMFVSNRTE